MDGGCGWSGTWADVEAAKAKAAQPDQSGDANEKVEAKEQIEKGAASMKFRKKPVVIEAVKFVLNATDPGDTVCGPIMRALDEIGCDFSDWVFAPDRIEIPTLEGTMAAQVGDWIIKGVKGEFYPCKPDIFEASYEAVAAKEQPAPVEQTGQEVGRQPVDHSDGWHVAVLNDGTPAEIGETLETLRNSLDRLIAEEGYEPRVVAVVAASSLDILTARIAELESKLAASEAACGAMRAVLQRHVEAIEQRWNEDRTYVVGRYVWDDMRAALASNAGRAFAERHAAMEVLLKDVYSHAGRKDDFPPSLMNKIRDVLNPQPPAEET